MKPALLIEQFNCQPVRVFGTPEEPLFVAADVCRILEIQNPTQAIAKLDTDERAMLNIGHVQGETNLVTESGLYTLILRCRDAVTQGTTAHAFRKWVTAEVLPAIRKTGSYSQSPALPQSLPEALRAYADAVEQKERLALENASMKPKADFVDRYVAAKGDKGFREVAKLLGANEHRFREFLEAEKIMYRLNGEWVPFQQHIEAKRFSVKAGVNRDNDHAYNQSKFTPKGVEWIAGLWGQHKVKEELATA